MLTICCDYENENDGEEPNAMNQSMFHTSGMDVARYIGSNHARWESLRNLVVVHETYGRGIIQGIQLRANSPPLIYIKFDSDNEVSMFNPDSFLDGHFTDIGLSQEYNSLFLDWLAEDEAKLQRVRKRELEKEQIKKANLVEVKQRWLRYLDAHNVHFLYHITHINNLPSIMNRGLLSHSLAENLPHRDISMHDVNERRAWCETIYGRPIHDYVPLYFNPRNPMLFKRRNIQRELLILAIRREVLFAEKILVTDGNAASPRTEIFPLHDIEMIDWNGVHTSFWPDYEDGKRKICAEVLVPDRIDSREIETISCNNPSLLKYAESRIPTSTPIRINTKLFFQT